MNENVKERISSLKKLQPHFLYIGILLILLLFVFKAFLSLDEAIMHDITTGYLPRVEILKKSVLEYNDFLPLWNPFFFAGTPLSARAYFLLDYPFPSWFALFMPVIVALKLTYLLGVFLAGVFMYILVHYLTKHKHASFIAALVYMFNGYITKVFGWGWMTTVNAYALTPLILLFMIKSFRSKEWVKYAILTGIMFALQIRAGPDLKVMLWVALIFGLYAAFSLIGKNLGNRLVKSVLIVFLVLAVIIGFSAQRILPAKDFLEKSSRGDTPWETTSKRQLKFSDIYRVIEAPKALINGVNTDHVGIIAFLLILYGVWKKRRNKIVLFFSASAILSIFLANNFLNTYYFLWKYIPPFDSTRYLDRTLILFVTAGSVLVGFGVAALSQKLHDLKWPKKKIFMFFSILAALVFIDLGVLGNNLKFENEQNVAAAIEQNAVLQHLSKKSELFRIHTFETRGIDWGTDLWNVPLGLQHIYAYDTQWYPPYFNVYLSFAGRNPSRFWGMLNTKYITARQEIEVAGLTLVQKFPDCEICYPESPDIQKAWGPYLYENEDFLPRAYVVKDAILVVGQDNGELMNSLKQTTYSLLLDQNFDPKKAVIIMKPGLVQQYDLSFLQNFKAIVLTPGSVDQGSGFALQQYVDQGGVLLPNVLEGEQSINTDTLYRVLNSSDGYIQIQDSNVIMHDFDTREIVLEEDTSGFLVFSEKFSEFDGWKATLHGKNIEILSANGIVSAFALQNARGSLFFKYAPRSHKIGSTITLLSILVVTLYFLNRRFKWL